MKKSTEMYKELEDLKNKIEALQAKGKIEEAYDKLEEVENLQKAIKVQETLEEEEVENFEGKEVEPTLLEKPDETVAFNKAVLGKTLNEPEAALVERIGEDGGYLVPEDQRTQINELKRQLIPLKDFCFVIPVNTLSGKMPLEVGANDELINFGELEEIPQSTIKFGQVTWELGDYGDIIPISNTLLQDEKANLTNYVGRRFAKKAVRTENSKILELLGTATKKTGEDWTAIQKALNLDLDPAIAANAIIITNQDGYDYLDSLVDGNGRPLLKDDLTQPGAKIFKGKRVTVLSNQHLESPSSGIPFYVGDLTEFLAFFDRQAYEMAVSTEAGFTRYTTMMRVVERFDVQIIDKDAAVYVEIAVEAPVEG